jgi:hypothetical protein
VSASTDFIILDGLPREKVAEALQVQARSDFAEAVMRVQRAFERASTKVASSSNKITEFRDAVASARLEVNNGADLFIAAVVGAEQLFQAGIDLQTDEPEPPQEEVPNNV